MNNEEKKTFARKLARWLDERELDQALPTEESERKPVTETLLNLPCKDPFLEKLEEGDVVLLSHELTPKDAVRPIYLAILRHWEDDHWLFAPYSPYSEPATDEELRMMDEDFGLRVLCLWNSHTAEKKTLCRSWHVGKLDETDRKEALSVFWYKMGMKELSERLMERVGPVLLHSKDPRRIYLREQLSLLALVRDETIEDGETEEDGKGGTVIVFVAWKGFLEDEKSDDYRVGRSSDGDDLHGGSGTDMLHGGSVDASPPEILFGGSAADEFHGGSGNDVLKGDSDDQRLYQEGGRMSASSKGKKPTRARYENRKLFLELTVRSIPRHDEVFFELKITNEDRHDRLDEFSVELKEIDGPSESFRNGECVYKVSLAKISFTLIDPDGKAVELHQIEERTE